MPISTIKNVLIIPLCFIAIFSAGANTPKPSSALEYQQTTNTRIVVEENYLRFFTGGSERMTIDAGGNVGIGRVLPNASLDVGRGDKVGGTAQFNGTERSSHFNYSTSEHTYIRGGKATSNVYINDNGGNVGIGTSTPGSYKLNVNGTLFVAGPIDSGGARPGDASADGTYLYGTYNTSFQFATSSWGASHAILFDAYKSGTSVNGGLSTTGNTKHTHGVGGYGGGAGSIHYNGNGGTMYFFISPQSTGAGTNVVWGTPKMMMQRDGTIGINTFDPDENYKLHVAGGIRATNYKSDVNSYADFVFEDDYRLAPLSEVEAYIEENNHLPDIPSEAEARKNGVDLQDMQAKLLQKIEELTLYVIDLKKENESQQKEIEELKSKKVNQK
ncbi:hypothetical protein [Reichenbachiella sp.]